MGLSLSVRRRLGQWAIRRPHVLLVTAPGGTAARLAVESWLRSAGGVVASGPAEADLLVVAGVPDPVLGAAIDAVWAQLPAPRVRVSVADPAARAATLAAALDELAQPSTTTSAESTEPHHPGGPGPHRMGMDDMSRPAPIDHGGHEHPDAMHHADEAHGGEHGGEHGGGHDAAGHDMGEMDMGGHDTGGHDMGEMDMGGMMMPGGPGMADRAADRDGLRLDVLHVPLGPVLPCWPAGVVLDTVLQGDVVQSADPRVLAGPAHLPAFWTGDAQPEPLMRAAAHLDSLHRLLALTGWAAAAGEAALLRDDLLAGTPVHQVFSRFERLRARVERSPSLRLATSGLGRICEADRDRLGLTGPAARATDAGGDARARALTWLGETARALAGDIVAPEQGPRGDRRTGSSALLAMAAELVVGLDLAAARVLVASLDPDPDELADTLTATGDSSPDPMRAGT